MYYTISKLLVKYELMNFKWLKSMIDSLVATYKCPECWEWATEDNVDIIGAAGNTINIDLVCGKCDKHSMIKSEVVSLDLDKSNISVEQLQVLREHLWSLGGKLSIPMKENKVSDEEITDLHKKLQESDLSLSDLFSENRDDKKDDPKEDKEQ